jgi:hypothetical protein
MRFRRILPPPSRFGRWLSGAIALGLLSPAAIAATITLAGYYPIGSRLPASALLTPFGTVLAIIAVAAGVLLAAPAYALLAWSWRPIALAALFEFCLFVGLAPAKVGAEALQRLAFDSLKSRSSELIKAITAYAHDKGMPPAALAQLVPDYLPAIPQTGIALAPHYKYRTSPALCAVSKKRPSDWHLLVSVRGFLIVHELFYCPGVEDWLYESSDGR